MSECKRNVFFHNHPLALFDCSDCFMSWPSTLCVKGNTDVHILSVQCSSMTGSSILDLNGDIAVHTLSVQYSSMTSLDPVRSVCYLGFPDNEDSENSQRERGTI